MASRKPNTKTSRLERLGLRSDMDFVLHLPMRYEDETRVLPVREAQMIAGSVQVEGIVTSSEIQYRPRRQLVACIADETGAVFLRFLHFYASQSKQLAVGVRIRARGELRSGFFGAEMIHPAYRVVTENTPLPEVLTPVYPSTEGVSQQMLRKEIASAMVRVDLTDTLPLELLERLNLPAFDEAVRLLHNPPPDVDENALAGRTHPAWRRMKFDELLAQQLSMMRAHTRRREQAAPVLSVAGATRRGLLGVLPFTLTDEQKRVSSEITESMCLSYPMQRLLQGDVGSGKTVVAALAAAQAIDSGYQVAMMAPTEILAEQHFQRVAEWMTPLGVEVAWLTGSLRKKEKEGALSRITSGEARLIIGTHALIQDDVHFDRLGLVIVDEQHRFGVGQRLMLRNKGETKTEVMPHQLMMSATPIPRTLAMTYYADLDVSVIHALPPGRTPVVTRLIDRSRRDEVIERIYAAALSGRQAYWVCPLIEESESLQLQTAVETHALLREALPGLCVGLVHGRLKQAEKQAVMDAFVRGEVHLLVATTVIEVGVDVPNASLMIIEHAERFGLSQLHQLRGRVGRGDAESVCLLLYQSPLGEMARQRLTTMRETTDGFVIARRDLEIRGPGEFLGARQSGQAMLRFADLQEDADLIDMSRKIAQSLLYQPGDASRMIVASHLKRWLGGFEDFLKV